MICICQAVPANMYRVPVIRLSSMGLNMETENGDTIRNYPQPPDNYISCPRFPAHILFAYLVGSCAGGAAGVSAGFFASSAIS